MQETKIGYRGSKLPMLGEKEQRIDGSYYCKFLILHSLRYILMGFEKNYQAINLSKQMNIHRTYSTQVVSSHLRVREYHINPKFITGFVDGFFIATQLQRNSTVSYSKF